MAPPLGIPARHRRHPLSREFLLLRLVLLLIVIAIVGAAQDEQADDGAESLVEAELLLPLPPEGDAAAPPQQQHQSRLGETLSLDELGPIVINVDGTMRRIANWKQLTKYEQERTAAGPDRQTESGTRGGLE